MKNEETGEDLGMKMVGACSWMTIVIPALVSIAIFMFLLWYGGKQEKAAKKLDDDWTKQPAFAADPEHLMGGTEAKFCGIFPAAKCKTISNKVTKVWFYAAVVAVLFALALQYDYFISCTHEGETGTEQADHCKLVFTVIVCTLLWVVTMFGTLMWATHSQNFYLEKRLETRTEQFHAIVGDPQWTDSTDDSASGSSESDSNSSSGESSSDSASNESSEDSSESEEIKDSSSSSSSSSEDDSYDNSDSSDSKRRRLFVLESIIEDARKY